MQAGAEDPLTACGRPTTASNFERNGFWGLGKLWAAVAVPDAHVSVCLSRCVTLSGHRCYDSICAEAPVACGSAKTFSGNEGNYTYSINIGSLGNNFNFTYDALRWEGAMHLRDSFEVCVIGSPCSV
jgi:hypothetical protein